MECIRSGVRWNFVDLADNAVLPGAFGICEQVGIKPSRTTASARRWCDHDPVDIHKARIACAEPHEIRAVVSRVLIEGEQEGVDVSNSSRQERLAYGIFQPLRLQPGQLPRMVIVEGKQVSPQRFLPDISAALTECIS